MSVRIHARRLGFWSALAVLMLPALPVAAEDGLDYPDFRRFQEAVALDVAQYWKDAFAAAELPYELPALTFTDRGQADRSACGADSADPADFPQNEVHPAFYCVVDHGVYFASGWLYRESYLEHGDFATAVLIAHEFGHHVQNQIGESDSSGQPCCGRSVRQLELEADCLAGVFAYDADQRGVLEEGDAEEGMRGSYASGDYDFESPNHHGTPNERAHWFLTGYESGDAGTCDP